VNRSSVKPLGSSLCAYILLAQAVSSLPDLLGHPSLQDIYLMLLIMVACFVVLYCEPFRLASTTLFSSLSRSSGGSKR
jgi:hypothetical protein